GVGWAKPQSERGVKGPHLRDARRFAELRRLVRSPYRRLRGRTRRPPRRGPSGRLGQKRPRSRARGRSVRLVRDRAVLQVGPAPRWLRLRRRDQSLARAARAALLGG